MMLFCKHHLSKVYNSNYDKDHTSAVQINNTSDPRSYKVKAVTNKAQKEFWGSNGIQTHDLRDTGAMLYRLSYEASLQAGQVRVQFIPIIWREWHGFIAHLVEHHTGIAEVMGSNPIGASEFVSGLYL